MLLQSQEDADTRNCMGFTHLEVTNGTGGKEPACQCRRHKRRGFDPWVGKILWSRAQQSAWYPCLENPLDTGAWLATVHGVARNRTRLKLAACKTQLAGHWFSSVQFSCSIVSDSLRPHESQHGRPRCPSPTPGVYSNSCPLSQWCHLAISSSVIPLSSCPQPLPASGSFPMSQRFAWGGRSSLVVLAKAVSETCMLCGVCGRECGGHSGRGGEVRQWEKHLDLSLWGQFGCEGSKYRHRTIEVDVVSMKDLI